MREVRLRERKSAVRAAEREDKKIGGAGAEAEAAAALEGVRRAKRRRGISTLAPSVRATGTLMMIVTDKARVWNGFFCRSIVTQNTLG